MNATKPSKLKLDVSFVNGVWEVVIFAGDHTEHKSFRTEDEAREYGATRLERLRLAKPKSEANGSKASLSR